MSVREVYEEELLKRGYQSDPAQLRAIEAGVPIVAGAIDHAARGIDTPQDYAAFVARRYSFTRSK